MWIERIWEEWRVKDVFEYIIKEYYVELKNIDLLSF